MKIREKLCEDCIYKDKCKYTKILLEWGVKFSCKRYEPVNELDKALKEVIKEVESEEEQ